MQVVCRALFLLFLIALPAQAAAPAGIYAIDNISADQSSDTPTNARNLAITEAQKQGFEILINMITTPDTRKALPKLTGDGIVAMVQSFEITEERITGNRYQGRFNIVYDERQVKEFLSQNKVQALEIKSPPVLVLPVFEEGEKATLWEQENPWRRAWDNGLSANSEIQLIVPMGDLEDIQRITGDELNKGKYDALLKFANKYGAREVMIARAQMKDSKTLLVRLQPVGNAPTLAGLMDYTQEFDAAGDGYWEQAVTSIQQKIAEQWESKGHPMEAFSSKHIQLIVAIRDGQDWIDIRNKLEGLQTVSFLNIREISLHRALLDVQYSGSFKQFEQELDKRNLEILQEGDSMVLRQREI